MLSSPRVCIKPRMYILHIKESAYKVTYITVHTMIQITTITQYIEYGLDLISFKLYTYLHRLNICDILLYMYIKWVYNIYIHYVLKNIMHFMNILIQTVYILHIIGSTHCDDMQEIARNVAKRAKINANFHFRKKKETIYWLSF